MPRHNRTAADRPNPKQLRREQAQRKARQTRMIAIIAGVVVVAALAVIIMVFANQPEAPVGAFATVEPGDWPQADGKALGPADAKVVVTEFADFQCPYCRVYNTDIQPQIVADYVKTGKIRYEYHHYIVIDSNVGGTESRRSAEASECAAEQGRFWDFHEILFTNQAGEGTGAFANNRLKAFAESLGLDMTKFNSCFDGRKTQNKVTVDEAQARTLGINSTPSLFVNGVRVANPVDYASVKAAIDAALAGK
jgi:protein-disulfide isomerase